MNLEELCLESTKNLQALPDEICGLTNLKILDLSESKDICALPDTIGNLTSLEAFNLYASDIKLLPCSVVYLSNLKVLDIGREVWYFYDSQELEGDLPDGFENLTKLEVLGVAGRCSGEYPCEVPPGVVHARNLRVLKVDWDQYVRNKTILVQVFRKCPCLGFIGVHDGGEINTTLTINQRRSMIFSPFVPTSFPLRPDLCGHGSSR